MDNKTEVDRSRNMSRVRSANTNPELTIRKLVYRLGYRYRLNVTSLPGKPDLVFRSRKKVIFVHGCFWHQHECRRGSRQPTTNQEYWRKKLGRNTARDLENISDLRKLGWGVLVIWECEINAVVADPDRLVQFLAMH
jgi:DNA mismatch endonuclease (patch repair protein)